MNTEKLAILMNDYENGEIEFDNYVAGAFEAITENHKLDYSDSTLLEVVIDNIYCTLGIILRTNDILNNKIKRVGEIIAVKTIN